MAQRDPAPFGTLLLRLRAAAGLTQEQLATRAGLSTNAISALESGMRRTPRFATVELLATALALDEQQRKEFVAAARGTIGGQVGAVATGRRIMADAASDIVGSKDSGTAGGPSLQSWRSAAELSPLVDRVHELETIVRSLVAGDTRLLTLTGPAGVGKTRLALAAAIRLAEETSHGNDRFPDGITLVDLTPIREPDLVPDAIARALGLLDIGGRPAIERLAEALGQRRQLVMLDNVEQVLPAGGPPLGDLLVACPGLAFLVTSRVPLQLRWEQTLRVAPLQVPDSTAPLPPLEALLAVPSVALFVNRARARRADFGLREEHVPLLIKIATQLDGLPLALELAAARLDVLPLSTLARRLDDRLQLLASDALDRPERQQSLEAAIGWSYDLLSEPERLLFRCLGVFVGRVSLDAISAVVRMVSAVGSAASGREVREESETRAGKRTLSRLLSLAQKSLLLPLPVPSEEPEDLGWLDGTSWQREHNAWRSVEEENEDPEPAFAMLETVRTYAEGQLGAEGEFEAARRAHAHYYLALAERANLELRGPNQRIWYLRLERDQDNLRAALRWLLDKGEQDMPDAAEREAGLQLAGMLGWFWISRGFHTEGLRWLEEALVHAPQAAAEEEKGEGADTTTRTHALLVAGALLALHGAHAKARVKLGEALALGERQRDLVASAMALTYLGNCAVLAGEVEDGTHQLQEALRRWEALGEPHGLGQTLFYLGAAAERAGDVTDTTARYTAALEQLDAAGDARYAGIVHNFLGVDAWKRGDLALAVEHIQAGLRTSIALQDRWLLSFVAQATAALVGSQTEPTARMRLLGAGDAMAQAAGSTLAWEQWPGAQEVVEVRQQLAQGEGAAAYQEGRTLPYGEVAVLAQRLLGEVATSASSEAEGGTSAVIEAATPRPESPLTKRERDVLQLVAQGLSSKTIGGKLFISERTVAQHLTAIFNKLGARSRAQAVAVAAQRGLL